MTLSLALIKFKKYRQVPSIFGHLTRSPVFFVYKVFTCWLGLVSRNRSRYIEKPHFDKQLSLCFQQKKFENNRHVVSWPYKNVDRLVADNYLLCYSRLKSPH